MPTTVNFTSLLATPPQSLKSLKIRIGAFDLDTMPLLAEKLQGIADCAGFFIQYLSLNLCMDETTGSHIQEVPWELIDNVLMAAGKWTSLRRFGLRVYVDHSKQLVDDSQSLKVWECILKIQLSRLTSGKRSFRFMYDFQTISYYHPDNDDEICWHEIGKISTK